MSIRFFSEKLDFTFSHEKELENLIISMTEMEHRSIQEVSVVFLDDESLLEINKQYLNHDYYTDIITFPYQYDPIHTDIFISIDRVQENAKRLEEDFQTELHRVIIHGMLHMMGYKDKENDEKKIMRAKEDFYLSRLKNS